MRTQAPLDWPNFFLADVQAGVGPFLAIYLLASQHWDAGKIGVVMMIAGVATVAARAPFGALIDWSWRPVPETAPFPARHRSPARQSGRCRCADGDRQRRCRVSCGDRRHLPWHRRA